MFEVDVDIGRLIALGAEEASEDEMSVARIDLGDPEAEADGRIGGRSSSLAENLPL